VIQKESLYLPGLMTKFAGGNGYDYMPGSDFASASLATAYNELDDKSSKNKIRMYYEMDYQMDYTGAKNFALYVKWQNLSSTAATAAKIIDFV
jgi:hypothetical protein